MKNKKKDMIDALRDNLGIITLAAKCVGISRQTHYDWMSSDPEYKKESEMIMEERGDFVENRLLQAISDGDVTAVIFYCKTKLRNRGYAERQEISLRGQLDVPASVEDAIKAIKEMDD